MRKVCCSSLLTLVLVASTGDTALAHDPSSIYGSFAFRWQPGEDRLAFGFDKSVPKGRWRTRINQGANEWNRHGRRVYFGLANPDQSRTAEPSFRCPTQRKAANIVFRAAFPEKFGAFIGLNFVCRAEDGRRPLYFRQYYNGSYPHWWTDPNSNGRIPYNKIDLTSAAAHEMGHATGWGPHLDDDGPDAGDKKDYKSYCRSFNQQTVADDVYGPPAGATPYTAKQTMCFAIAMGQVGQRNLGNHDRGTFRAAYGPR